MKNRYKRSAGKHLAPRQKHDKQRRAEESSSSTLEELREMGQELTATKQEAQNTYKLYEQYFQAWQGEKLEHIKTKRSLAEVMRERRKMYLRFFIVGVLTACTLIKIGFLVLK